MSLTIKDIAALAKVSKGTVSKVLNDAPGVSTATRVRVMKLIRDLDYQPNAAAQGLASRRTHNIGVIIPHTGAYSMSSAYWPLLLTAITERAAENAFNVLLSTARSEGDFDSAYRSILRGRRVDGLVIGAEQFGQQQLAELLVKGFPFVMVGRSRSLPHYHVDVDNAGGVAEMTRYLLGLGHRRVVMVAGPERLPSVKDRVEAFRATMEQAGAHSHVIHQIYAPPPASESRIGEIRAALEAAPRCSALFVGAGDLVPPALGAVGQLGLRVPDDLALVAFDDHPFFAHLSPPLTAVEQPTRELGLAATEMLLALMAGEEPESRSRVLPTRIVHRASCGGGMEAGGEAAVASRAPTTG
jgi:LacI family transcriptional regulator, galactose operon repressor